MFYSQTNTVNPSAYCMHDMHYGKMTISHICKETLKLSLCKSAEQTNQSPVFNYGLPTIYNIMQKTEVSDIRLQKYIKSLKSPFAYVVEYISTNTAHVFICQTTVKRLKYKFDGVFLITVLLSSDSALLYHFQNI